jgi:hypothetical protein
MLSQSCKRESDGEEGTSCYALFAHLLLPSCRGKDVALWIQAAITSKLWEKQQHFQALLEMDCQRMSIHFLFMTIICLLSFYFFHFFVGIQFSNTGTARPLFSHQFANECTSRCKRTTAGKYTSHCLHSVAVIKMSLSYLLLRSVFWHFLWYFTQCEQVNTNSWCSIRYQVKEGAHRSPCNEGRARVAGLILELETYGQDDL